MCMVWLLFVLTFLINPVQTEHNGNNFTSYNGCHRLKKVSSIAISPVVSRFATHSKPLLFLPSSHSLYCCAWDVLNHMSWQVWWLYYPGLWRADPGHPLLWLVICIFIAVVASSVNTPLTPRATPGPNGITLLSHLKWKCLLSPQSALAEAQVPVDLAFWDGNGVSSHVNVDFPLRKMIDLCCAVAVNRQ